MSVELVERQLGCRFPGEAGQSPAHTKSQSDDTEPRS